MGVYLVASHCKTLNMYPANASNLAFLVLAEMAKTLSSSLLADLRSPCFAKLSETLLFPSRQPGSVKLFTSLFRDTHKCSIIHFAKALH